MNASRQMRVFFYGLFMDRALLEAKGFHPRSVEIGRLHGYRLLIGHRATLVPAQGGLVYGVLTQLTEPEVEALYAEPSVSAYRPQQVTVETGHGEVVSAVCFNLEEPPQAGEANPEYAAHLRELAEELHFPPEYVASIQ